MPYEAVPYFAVALVSREAAIQLEWGLSQRAAAWSSTPVPACMQGAPPPEGAETVLREHGARLGLDEATIAEYVRTGSADPAGTLSAMISRVVSSISLEDLGLGSPLAPDQVPWLVGRLIGFLGPHLAQTAQMAQAAWASDSDTGERSADGVSFGPAVEFVPSTRMRGERPGWVFLNGRRGLGYYRQAAATKAAKSHGAAAALPTSAPPPAAEPAEDDVCEVTPKRVTSSSAQSQVPKLFDKNGSTYWESSSQTKPHWVEMHGMEGELVDFSVAVKGHDSYSLRNIKVKVQREGTTSWETLVTTEISERPSAATWRKLLTPKDRLANVTGIRFESLDGHGINCRITGFRVRVMVRPALRAPPSAALGCTSACCARVAPAPLAALQAALASLAAGAPGAAKALAALEMDPDAQLAAYALLIDFVRALPTAPLGRELEGASEGATWRRRCATRLLLPPRGPKP